MSKKDTQSAIDHYTRLALERGGVVGHTAAIPGIAAPETPEDKPVKFVTPLVVMRDSTLVALVPVATASETNQREWKARSRRTQAARLAVSKTFGRHLMVLAYVAALYHDGRALEIVFTRLGGRKMDHSNLNAAMKATEDALALMMGADDGDARWRSRFEQEPGGAVGVRIEITEAS